MSYHAGPNWWDQPTIRIVKCSECGRTYQPRTLAEQMMERCPEPLHAVAKLRKLGVWID